MDTGKLLCSASGNVMSPNKVCGVGMEMGYMLCCLSFFFFHSSISCEFFGFYKPAIKTIYVKIAILFEIACSGLNNTKSESRVISIFTSPQNDILLCSRNTQNLLVMYFCKCLKNINFFHSMFSPVEKGRLKWLIWIFYWFN